MPQLAVANTLWAEYEQLEKPVRAGVRKAMAKFQMLTTAELLTDKGLGLRAVPSARDPRMRTIRITAFWRGVVLAPNDGSDTFLLVKVLPHDAALQWAANRLYSVNSATHSLEVRNVAAIEQLTIPQANPHLPERLFAQFSDESLGELGIDPQTLGAVRTVTDKAQLDAFAPLLPEDQYEVLQYLAEGFTTDEIYRDLVTARRPVDSSTQKADNLATAIANTRGRITLVANAGELEEIAGKPLVVPQRGELVSYAKRGERKDYLCERLPLVGGGQADVFQATHKPSGAVVALKKLREKYPFPRQVARMGREIELGRRLNGHPHAMPILDFDPKNTWFVMPYAENTVEQCRDELTDITTLRALLEALCSVLAVAHREGWVHRDIKPANVLRLDNRWVLADWGIVRRPPGQTTDPQRTRVGVFMGSDGFAAPELYNDAHQAGATADIYSLGQFIGWAVTGEMPLVNVPLIPKSGPWRTIVREATQRDPARRPATVSDFLDLIGQELDAPPEPPILRGELLKQKLDDGSLSAGEELISLAAAHTDDATLYCDLLIKVPLTSLMPDFLTDPHRAVEVVCAMATLLGTHRPPERGEVDATIMWLITIAKEAAQSGELDLLEACCSGAFEWDALWDQWTPQANISPWLSTLTGDCASSVAAMLRQHPGCAAHFRHLADEIRVDHRIRVAVTVD
ncbi:serine/threonine-protein kinase [Streptomyces sp. NPDC088253]|uniref:serine/threonine-protein kinase n=1 Tax=Streptomyces sp. NPDC088253 TaxID=3365846 RepID=UPI00380E8818